MVSLVNSHTNATRIGWHLWETDLRFAPGLPPGWISDDQSLVILTGSFVGATCASTTGHHLLFFPLVIFFFFITLKPRVE